MIKKVLKAFPRAIKDPIRAVKLFRRRFIPFGLLPKDPQANRIASWNHGVLPREHIVNLFPSVKELDIITKRTFNRTIDLSMDEYEVLVLCALIKANKVKNVLEIGTWDGNTALNIAANLPSEGKIYTLDLPPDSEGKMSLNIPAMLNNLTDRTKLGKQFEEADIPQKIIQIYGDSAQVDFSAICSDLDLILIDGCHAYSYVKSDTLNALQALKGNGIIVWHDYGMIEDVSRYVDEFSRDNDVKVIQGTRFAVYHQRKIANGKN